MSKDTPIRQDVMDLANIIENKIVADFTDRRGLRQEWEQIDSSIQNEIEQTWIEIIYDEIEKWLTTH